MKIFIRFLHNLKKINYWRNLVVTNYSLANYKFIIFCSLNKAKNFKFLYLKNEIKKLNCISFFSNPKFIKIFKEISDFKFLNTHILIIPALNLKNLIELIKLLNYEGIWFFFLHTTNLSRVFNFNMFESHDKKNPIFNLNFLIYRLIVRIFFILALFIRSSFLLITNYKL